MEQHSTQLIWSVLKMENELPKYSDLKSLSEEERSILIIEKLRTVIVNQTNHLRHHWAITLVCAAACLAGVFNFGVALLILFYKVPK